VGKTTVAYHLAQFFEDALCIDFDPLNHSFASYPALKAEKVALIEQGKFRRHPFEALIKRVFEDNRVFVVDVGASAFQPFGEYIHENRIDQFLAENGMGLTIHCVVAGAGVVHHTVNSLKSVLRSIPEAQVLIWFNHHFSPITNTDEIMKPVAKTHRSQLLGAVELPHYDDEFFPAVIERLHSDKLTYAEALEREDWFVLDRSRAFRMKQRVFDQLHKVFPTAHPPVEKKQSGGTTNKVVELRDH
jgi:hypothetical protein